MQIKTITNLEIITFAEENDFCLAQAHLKRNRAETPHIVIDTCPLLLHEARLVSVFLFNPASTPDKHQNTQGKYRATLDAS